MSDNKKKDREVKKPSKAGNLFKRWQEPERNKMGNDISSEIKIANNKGKSEGGEDKRWHMKEE